MKLFTDAIVLSVFACYSCTLSIVNYRGCVRRCCFVIIKYRKFENINCISCLSPKHIQTFFCNSNMKANLHMIIPQSYDFQTNCLIRADNLWVKLRFAQSTYLLFYISEHIVHLSLFFSILNLYLDRIITNQRNNHRNQCLQSSLYKSSLSLASEITLHYIATFLPYFFLMCYKLNSSTALKFCKRV